MPRVYKSHLTSRTFELIARVIRQHREQVRTDPIVMRALVSAFADELQATNPLFDRHRFIAACEVSS